MKRSDIEVTLVDSMGSDLSVVNAARVSFNKDSLLYTDEQNEKLISYLARNKHTSPFNHAFLSVRVKAPIFVARQLVKHKFMPWNEVSRRYVDDEPEFYLPEVYRKKADNVKQGSSDESVEILRHHDPVTGEAWAAYVGNSVQLNSEYCLRLYKDMLEAGICPEQARMVLPLNTMTEWVWSGSLGAFADMLKLRLDPHTQYESRIVAQKIEDIVSSLFPISLKALLENK